MPKLKSIVVKQQRQLKEAGVFHHDLFQSVLKLQDDNEQLEAQLRDAQRQLANMREKDQLSNVCVSGVCACVCVLSAAYPPESAYLCVVC